MGFIQDKIAGIVKAWEGGVGAGLDEKVCEAYNFIVRIPASVHLLTRRSNLVM